MLILLFILLLSFPVPSFAAPAVTIDTIPAGSVIGDTFPVTFSVANADVGATYYYKIFGGIGDNDSSVQNYYNADFLNYTSPWASFPILTIGDSGNAIAAAFARIDTGHDSGNYRIQLRIHSGNSSYDSEPRTITIAAPTPTPTPVPTDTPTPTATSTPTIVPTSTFTPTPSPTKTPTPSPTATRTPTPTLVSTPTPTPTIIPTDPPDNNTPIIDPPAPLVLGIQTTTPPILTPKSNYLPLVLIISGGLLLLTPLLINVLKKG